MKVAVGLRRVGQFSGRGRIASGGFRVALKSSPASMKMEGDAEAPVSSRKAAAVSVSWVRVTLHSPTTRETAW